MGNEKTILDKNHGDREEEDRQDEEGRRQEGRRARGREDRRDRTVQLLRSLPPLCRQARGLPREGASRRERRAKPNQAEEGDLRGSLRRQGDRQLRWHAPTL